MAAIDGEKNRVSAKQAAVIKEAKPVRPPASIPVADSMYAPAVVVPTNGANIVASASVSMGRSICGNSPFSSRKPARADTPISVPIVSTKAITKIVSTTGKKLQLNTPEKSSLRKTGARLGGALIQACGRG